METLDVETDEARQVSSPGAEAAPDASEPGPTRPESPELQILEAAIHILDHRRGGLALSDAAVELTPPVIELFRSYIVRSMRAETLRTARFSGEGAAQKAALGVLDGSMEFLDGSRRIAAHLYSVMQNKSRSAGDLAIIRARETPTSGEMLAVLKLDLQRGLRRVMVEENGRILIRLQPVPELLPEGERRLQKCAFIPAPPHSYPYDVALLDQQSGGRESAGFFTQDFLECEVEESAREWTRRLPQETERWLQAEGVEPAVAIEARQALVQAIQGPEVDLEALARQVAPGEDRQARYLDHLESAGFERRSYSMDPAVADRLNSTLTYLLDGRVKITGDAEQVAELLQVDLDPTTDGKVRILIESARFERRY